MRWRHFLSQIQRLESVNNVPGLTPSYKKTTNIDLKGFKANQEHEEMDHILSIAEFTKNVVYIFKSKI